jgi:hypothetical protein
MTGQSGFRHTAARGSKGYLPTPYPSGVWPERTRGQVMSRAVTFPMRFAPPVLFSKQGARLSPFTTFRMRPGEKLGVPPKAGVYRGAEKTCCL